MPTYEYECDACGGLGYFQGHSAGKTERLGDCPSCSGLGVVPDPETVEAAAAAYRCRMLADLHFHDVGRKDRRQLGPFAPAELAALEDEGAADPRRSRGAQHSSERLLPW